MDNASAIVRLKWRNDIAGLLKNRNIDDYVIVKTCANIRMKAKKLGLAVPNAVWLLPKNFVQLESLDNVVYESDYDTVIKILNRGKIPCSLLEKDRITYPKLVQRNFEFLALPIIVFTIEYLRHNPNIILAALNLLNSLFERRVRNDPNSDRYVIRSKVIKETKRGVYKEYTYEGPPSAFKDFIKMVQSG